MDKRLKILPKIMSGDLKRSIHCECCLSLQPAATFYTRKNLPVTYSNANARALDQRFGGKICRDCHSFWSLRAKVRKTPDEQYWQFCENRIQAFFEKRGIPTARTVGPGTDIMILLFKHLWRIEVKSGWFSDGNIKARRVTHKRKKDDLVVVILPTGKTFWMPMGEYLAHSNQTEFTYPKELHEKKPVSYYFESAFIKAAKKKNLEVADFRIFRSAA